MVAHFTMHTQGVNQAFRFVESIWLRRKSRQIRFFFLGNDLFYFIRAQHVMSYHLDKVPWKNGHEQMSRKFFFSVFFFAYLNNQIAFLPKKILYIHIMICICKS